MPGASVPIHNLRRRVQSMERLVGDLHTQIMQMRSQSAVNHAPAYLFLAKTIKVGTTYPSPPANVFGFRVVTASFTHAEGNQTITYSTHSANYQEYAFSPMGYVEEGSVVFVLRMRNGQYVIVPLLGTRKLVRFTLAAAMTTSDASKSATITDQYGPGEDGPTTAGGITVHNLETHTSGTHVFEGDSGDTGYAYHDAENDYIILQMECP